jgi:hypothetical protein
MRAANHCSVAMTDSTVGGSVRLDQRGFYLVVNRDIEDSIPVKASIGASRLACMHPATQRGGPSWPLLCITDRPDLTIVVDTTDRHPSVGHTSASSDPTS